MSPFKFPGIRNRICSAVAAALAFAAPAVAVAAPTLTSPVDYAEVEVQTKEMQSFLATSTARTKSTYTTKNTTARTTYQSYYAANNLPVTLKWTGTSGSSTVRIYRSSDLSTPVFTQTTSATSLEFWEAEIGRNYTWSVENGGQKATGHFFVVRTAPRIINAPHAADPTAGTVGNARDLGGWLTGDGKVVRQGRLFRTRQFDWCWAINEAKGKSYNGNKYWSQTMGIKYDVDLREIGGDSGIRVCLNDTDNYPLHDGEVNKSPLGPNIPRYTTELDGLANFADGKNSITLKEKRIAFHHVFAKLRDQNNWPLVFHCAHGKDRTGQLAMIVLGLLGVDFNSIALDYCGSWMYKADWAIPTGSEGFQPDVLKKELATRYGSGLTLKAQCEAYVKECASDAGATLTDADIANFRNAMLEDPETREMPAVGGTPVVPPTLTVARVEFDRKEHAPTIKHSADSAKYTVTIPAVTYKDQGVYYVTVALKDPANTYWADTNTNTERKLKYVIYWVSSESSYNTPPSIASWQKGNDGAAVWFTGLDARGVGTGTQCSYTKTALKNLEPGTYTATFTVPDGDYYTPLSLKKTFRVLPADARPVRIYEYVELNQDTSFVTGLTPDWTKAKLTMTFAFSKSVTQTWSFGLCQASDKFFIYGAYGDSGHNQIFYRNGDVKDYITGSANYGTGKHTVTVCQKKLTFDGTSTSSTSSPAANKDAAFPLIFCATYQDAPDYQPKNFRFYGAKIYSSSTATTPTHDYVPATLDDGTAVLYDKVTGTLLPPTFKTSTARATAGGSYEEIAPEEPPEEHVHTWSAWSADTATKETGGTQTRRCTGENCTETQTRTTPQKWDWLKTDGCYVTDYTPNLARTRIEMKLGYFANDTTGGLFAASMMTVVGNWTKDLSSASPSKWTDAMTFLVDGGNLDYYNDSLSEHVYPTVGLPEADKSHTYVVLNNTVTVDGDRTFTAAGTAADKPAYGPLAFLATNAGKGKGFENHPLRKVYSIGVSTNGVTVMSLRPAKNASGVATLWDEVSGVYLTANGGGTFEVGNGEVTPQEEEHVHTWGEWGADTATKEAAGTQTRSCTDPNCHETETRATPQKWDWLRTDGKGYVCTGWKPNLATFAIDLDVRFGEDVVYGEALSMQGLLVGNGNISGLGNYYNALNLNFEKSDGTSTTGVNWEYDYYSAVNSVGGNAYVGLGGVETHVQHVTLAGKSITLDGETRAYADGAYASAELSSDLYLLTSYSKSKARYVNQTSADVFGVTLKDGGTVVHKYRPAKDANGVATLYDEVTGTYLEVLNGGVFEVGNDEAEEPPEEHVHTWGEWGEDTATKEAGGMQTRYCTDPNCHESDSRSTPQKWDWLRTDGRGFVNTGWRPNLATFAIDLRVRFGGDVLAGDKMHGLLVGNGYMSEEGGYKNALNLYFQRTDGSSATGANWEYDYYSAVDGVGGNAYIGLVGEEPRVQSITLSGKSITLDGVTQTYASGAYASAELSSDLYLMTSFSRKSEAFYNQMCGDVFGVTLKDGATVVHKYRPAKDENGVATLYDEVTGEYLEVLNGGVFAVGNDEEEEPLGAADTSAVTYTLKRSGASDWGVRSSWESSAATCHGVPDAKKWATAVMPETLDGAAEVKIDRTYTVNRLLFQNEQPVTLAFEGANAGLVFDNGSYNYTADTLPKIGFGSGAEGPITTLRFTVPAGGWSVAPLRVALDNSPMYVGMNTKFVVDASALAAPSGDAETVVKLISAKGNKDVRFFDEWGVTSPVRPSVFPDTVFEAAEVTLPAGAKGGLKMVNGEVCLVLRNASWQPTPVAQPENPDVYLLIGQSNMAGYGTGDCEPVSTDGIWKWELDNDRWIAATDPLVDGCGVGLGCSFARQMADACEKPVAIINAARGATWLSQWEEGDPLYERAVGLVRKALAQGGTFKGILWHQGCYDAIEETLATTYSERLQQMVAALRSEFGAVPFVCGELNCSQQTADRPYWNVVNAQLTNAVSQLADARLVSAAGFTFETDNQHFDAASQRTFGKRYATAMCELLGVGPQDDPSHDDPQPTGEVTTNAMANASWGYTITGLGDDHRDVALVFTNTTYTSSDPMNYSLPDGVDKIWYLVVGGGGSGGTSYADSTGGGGGGGAGGMLEAQDVAVGSSQISVFVGKGGAAVTATGNDNAASRPAGNTGGNSSLTVDGVAIVAHGGGGGGGYGSTSGKKGGSGGGAYRYSTAGVCYDGEGNAGGRGTLTSGNNGGGGGGGAGGVGGNAGGASGGKGGDGKISYIGGGCVALVKDASGNDYYCAGGGGGSAGTSNGGAGGIGGGGAGNTYNGSAATTSGSGKNYGCGGGGTQGNQWKNHTSGAGYQGVVIIRYTVSGDEPQTEKPTVGGEEVAPEKVFEVANSQQPIVYPAGKTVTVDGEVGAQTIVFGGTSVKVPRYYTAALEGQTVSLALNDFAKPVFDDEEGEVVKPGIAVAADGTVSLHLANVESALWYTLKAASSLAADAEWTPVSGPTRGAADFTDESASAAARFYRVEVTDVAPADVE